MGVSKQIQLCRLRLYAWMHRRCTRKYLDVKIGEDAVPMNELSRAAPACCMALCARSKKWHMADNPMWNTKWNCCVAACHNNNSNDQQ
jgi:hypothetical protein